MTSPIELDGTEAGGQFVRTALGLSVLEEVPIRVENIRGNRPTPGLGHQHLTTLETMADLADACVSGAALGSEMITFEPGRSTIPGGHTEVEIPTAGSIALLFDAVLPLAVALESPLSLTVTGGTDVKWAPPIDYFRAVKLPLCRRIGLSTACEVHRRGFYPDGGGRATLQLAPSTIEPLEFVDRGAIEGIRLYSTTATSLADRDVARRQLEGAIERLDSTLDVEVGPESDPTAESAILERRLTTAVSSSPGSAILIRLDHETGFIGTTALGERGRPAERVGKAAADELCTALEGTAPVDRHATDQLLVFLGLGGGQLRVSERTDHVRTSRNLLETFGVEFESTTETEGTVLAVESASTVGV